METYERIKTLRKTLNMSQEEFGKSLGVSRDVIGNIEYDRLKKPDQKEPIYLLICEKFNVNKDWLIFGSGEMFNKLSEEDELGVYLGKIGSGKHERIETIIKAYFRLSEESKKGVDDYLDTLFDLAQSQKEQDQ